MADFRAEGGSAQQESGTFRCIRELGWEDDRDVSKGKGASLKGLHQWDLGQSNIKTDESNRLQPSEHNRKWVHPDPQK